MTAHPFDDNSYLLSDRAIPSTYSLGDRVAQTASGQTMQYTLDMNAGLTQVLDDGTTATCTEIDRIAHDNRLKRPLNTLNYVDYTDAEPAEWWHFEPYGK